MILLFRAIIIRVDYWKNSPMHQLQNRNEHAVLTIRLSNNNTNIYE